MQATCCGVARSLTHCQQGEGRASAEHLRDLPHRGGGGRGPNGWVRLDPGPRSGRGDGTDARPRGGQRREGGVRAPRSRSLRQAWGARPQPPVALGSRRPTGPSGPRARLRAASGRLTMLTKRVST